MPQTNRLRRSRKTSRRTPWYKKKYNAMQIASKALSGVNYIRGLVNSELKFHDVESSTTFSNSGAMINLTEIAGGSGDAQRNGNSIFVRYITLRGIMAANTNASYNTCRMIVFIDKDTSGTTPTASDVLATTTTGFVPIAPLNDTNRARYKVLTSKLVLLSPSDYNEPFKSYMNIRHHVRYNSATATDTDKGQIYCLFVSDQDTLTPLYTLHSRVAYHDN